MSSIFSKSLQIIVSFPERPPYVFQQVQILLSQPADSKIHLQMIVGYWFEPIWTSVFQYPKGRSSQQNMPPADGCLKNKIFYKFLKPEI